MSNLNKIILGIDDICIKKNNRYIDIYNELINMFKNIFGEDFNIDKNSINIQLIEGIAFVIFRNRIKNND